jgi:predicted Zn finger-like uncharacterized protein
MMGKIAQLQMECPSCKKITNVYVEESNAARTQVKCEHCKNVFEFGPGMMYKPIGYVTAIPKWAEIKK